MHPLSFQQAYQHTQVTTAAPEQLVVMLYDGIVRFLLRGQEQLAADQWAPATDSIGRAQDIITELLATLRADAGDGFATNLARLYEFWHWQLSQVIVRHDPALVDPVLAEVQDLRTAWQQAAQGLRAGRTPTAGVQGG